MRSTFNPSSSELGEKNTWCEFMDLRFINKKTETKFIQTFYLQQKDFLVKFNLTMFFFLIFAIFISTEYI